MKVALIGLLPKRQNYNVSRFVGPGVSKEKGC